MRVKSFLLWAAALLSLAVCLLVSIARALAIYRQSQVLASGKLSGAYTSLALNFGVTFVIFLFFLTLALKERRVLR